MNTSNSTFSTNNFDIIRLFAAAQVAHYHIFHIMNINIHPWHKKIIEYWGLFPGVPIFFFISGFLISRSWERNTNLTSYTTNRILRIYPGLIAAVILDFLLVNISGHINNANPEFIELSLLFIAKSSIFQFYNPGFMRQYGDGVMNGSLWTITVELQFYILTPLLYYWANKTKNISVANFITINVCIFLIINIIFNNYLTSYEGLTWYKLLRVSFAPWIYMFLIGVIFQKNFERIYEILHGKFIYCLLVYLLIALMFRKFGADFGNSMNPLLFIFLAVLIFSFAYSNTNLSMAILQKTDISYGIYIYHMPIVNYLIYTNYFSGYQAGAIALMLVITTSLLSWHVLEKKFLKLKNKKNHLQNHYYTFKNN